MELNLKENELILKIKDNSVLSAIGDYILGYKITYPEKFSLAKEDYGKIHNLWHNTLKNLPTGCIIVKDDLYLKKGFDTSTYPHATFFQKVTNNHFEGRNYLQHTGYIFFIWTGLNTLRNESIKNPFIFPRATASGENESLNNFIVQIDQAKSFINRSNILELTDLTEDEVLSYYQFYFGGFNSDYVTDTAFNSKSLKSAEKTCGIFALTNERNLPDYVDNCTVDSRILCKSDEFVFYKNDLDELGLTLDCNHLYHQIIFIDDHKSHIATFENQRRELMGSRKFSPSNESGLKKMDDYFTELSSDSDFRYVRANNSVLFWADKESEFNQIKNTIAAIFRENNIKPYYPTGVRLKNLFYNSFFTNVSLLDNNSLYLADLRVPIAYFVNTSNYRSDAEGILLNERLYNVPVRFDFWDKKKKNLQSRNFIIVAPTGSGKSVTFEHIARQLLEDGVILVIIDLGGSYVKFSKLLPQDDVAYFRYKEGQPIGLNPFAYSGELTADRIDEVCEFIWTLVKREQIANEEEKTSLRKIVSHYYTLASVTGDTNFHWFTFYNFVKNNRDNLCTVLEIPESYFNMEQFLHNGSEFLPGGSYHFLFDDKEVQAKENFKGKRLILFELDDVKDNRMLLNIMLLSISSAINKAIWCDKTNRGIVFFDEFAKQMEFPAVLDKVKFYSQAIRKQEGALGLILQSVNQFPETPPAKTILDNSETLIFLNMSTKGYKDTVSRLELGKHVEAQLNSMSNNYAGFPAYSELFIYRKSIKNVYRIELPKPIFYVYQTEGATHEEMMRRYEKIGNMETVVEQMMNENILK